MTRRFTYGSGTDEEVVCGTCYKVFRESTIKAHQEEGDRRCLREALSKSGWTKDQIDARIAADRAFEARRDRPEEKAGRLDWARVGMARRMACR